MRFQDKVAIVTGAGQGIGEDYARALSTEGACVVVADINEEKGQAVAKSIEAAGGRAAFVRADVSSESSALAATAFTIETFGAIDFLINNAAIYGGMMRASWMDVPLDYYRRFMSVNFDGALIMTRAVYKHMQERGGGAIINQSSAAAFSAGGYYGLAKLATNGLTNALAKELGPQGIRVNAIAPGPIDTEATNSTVPAEMLKAIVSQLPLGRVGTTSDVVKACLFLLSAEADWVTGQTLCVDGGMVLRP